MKKALFFIVIILVVFGIFCFVFNKEAIAPVVSFVQNETKNFVPQKITTAEYCYANIGVPDENGNYDIDTLRLILNGDKVKGELNILPGGKDSKTGEFEGTVSTADSITKKSTADLWWFSLEVGNPAKEQLKIIFDNNVASVGFGEMINQGGVYVYKDPKNISYNLNISKIACLNLTKRGSVVNYLQDNIETLSPVKPILGGSWYILYETIDLEKNSGTVVYEDGHAQEKRTFTYTTDKNGVVTGMIIK